MANYYFGVLKSATRKEMPGFKDFLLRSNIVDARWPCQGVAFGLVVSAFIGKVVNPLINAITAAISFRPEPSHGQVGSTPPRA